MTTNNKSGFRWSLLAGYLGTIFFMMSCTAMSGAQLSEDGLFRLNNNVVEVKDNTGDWVPVGGASFELVGALENTDPWTVAGTVLETRATTQIDEGLEVGALVRVRGVVLEDKTWVAFSIELVDVQTEPVIVLIGIVDSMNPWIVNGISLNATDQTDIQGDITVGMIVRVEIQLAEDGTWTVLTIVPLSDVTETSGCVTVIATVVNANGNEIQFLGWPSTVIFKPAAQNVTPTVSSNSNEEDNNDQGDDENEGDDNSTVDITTLGANQVVQAVVCISDNGQLVIVQIVVLSSGENEGGDSADNGEKVLICHKPNKKGGHTLSLPQAAIPAHLGHGDTLGPCP